MDEGLSSQRLGEMQCLIYAAQTRRWYREPTDEDEQYAARYVDLLKRQLWQVMSDAMSLLRL